MIFDVSQGPFLKISPLSVINFSKLMGTGAIYIIQVLLQTSKASPQVTDPAERSQYRYDDRE